MKSKQLRLLTATFIILVLTILPDPNVTNTISFLEGQSLHIDNFTQNTISSAADPEGLLGSSNFIPTGGEHFKEADGGDELWYYPSSSSYLDTYWGDGVSNTQNTTSTQLWNPDNDQIYEADTQVDVSTDFDDWTSGFGAISLDPATRDRIFNPSDVDMNATTVEISTDIEDGEAGSFYTSYNDQTTTTTDLYPGPNENDPTDRDFTRTGDDLSINLAQRTWWDENYYVAGNKQVTATISLDWDVTIRYQNVFKLKFYYEDTSASTSAVYGVDGVSFTPVGTLGTFTDPGGDGSYSNTISGNITYVILDSSLVTVPGSDSGVRTFQSVGNTIEGTDDGQGGYDYDIDTSSDFGSSLTDGWYTLQLTIDMAHHKTGSYSFSGIGRTTILEQFLDTMGVQMDISNPHVSISESTPYDFSSGSEEVLITSNWVDWGENREVWETAPEFQFGYQIPAELVGYDGTSATLENGKTMAKLEIDSDGDGGADFVYTQIDSSTFADVRELDPSGFGVGCEQFSWTMNSTVIGNLNNSVQIRWLVGVKIDSGLELDYDSTIKSRVYFNNIDFTVQTRVKIAGTFTFEDLWGSLEENDPDGYYLNAMIQHTVNGETFYASTQIDTSSITFPQLYNGTWRLTVNKTVDTSGDIRTVTIFDSDYIIDISTASFSQDFVCNLTNIEYTVMDQFGDLLFTHSEIDTAHLIITSLDDASEFILEINDVDSTAFVEEFSSGNWQYSLNITVNSKNYTIASYSSTLNINPDLDTKYLDRYFIKEDLQPTGPSMLTNLELNVTDPNGLAVAVNTKVQIYDTAEPSTILEEYTVDGNVTIPAITNGTWQLVIFSDQNDVIYNNTYEIATHDFIIYDTLQYNLTNLEIEFLDYKGNALDESTDTFDVYLSNAGSGASYQSQTSGGNASFTQISNGELAQSWNLLVNVTNGNGEHKIFNAPLSIETVAPILYLSYSVNLTTLELTVQNIDSIEIENAEVVLTNIDSSDFVIAETDNLGQIQFREVFEGNWELEINYTIGNGGFYTKEYTIKSFSSYSGISLTLPSDSGNTYLTQDIVSSCNLTTVDLYVYDQSTAASNPEFAGLYLANVTMKNASAGVDETLATYVSNADGYIQFQIPATTYNFSVEYQSIGRAFKFNGSGDSSDFLNIHQKSLTSAADSPVFMLVELGSLILTRVSVDDYLFEQSGSSWSQGSGQNIQFSTLPHYLYLYYNDSVELSFLYEEAGDGTDILGAMGTWYLALDGNTINSSATSPLALDEIGSGIYNLSLFTRDYGAGTYTFSIQLDGGGSYQTTTYEFSFIILNQTTTINLLSDESALTQIWGEDLSLDFEYTTLVPEVGRISGAEFTYSIAGTSFNGISLTPAGNTYTLVLDTTDLEVGSFTVSLYAFAGNVTEKTSVFLINILNVATASTHDISDDELYVISSSASLTSLKLALGESFSLYFNYSLAIDGSLGSAGNLIAGSSVTATLSGWGSPDQSSLVVLDTFGTSLFNFTFIADDFAVGSYSLVFVINLGNYSSQTFTVDIEVLTTWDTSTELYTPPDPTSWGNNVSFIIQYYTSDTPRNFDLSGATISKLTVSYREESSDIFLMDLLPTSAMWSFYRFGDAEGPGLGYYNITLNTSIFTITEAITYSIEASISTTLYAESICKAFLYVMPVETNADLSILGASLSSHSMLSSEAMTFQAQVMVSDSDSIYYGDYLEGVELKLIVYNASDLQHQFLQLFNATVTDGIAEFTLNGEILGAGEFLIEITYTVTNYVQDQFSSFSLSIEDPPRAISIAINSDQRVSSSAIKVAYTEFINFTILFDDILSSYPDMIATVNSIEMNRVNISASEVGYFRFTLEVTASSFPILGSYSIMLYDGSGNEVVLTQYLDLEVLAFWPTRIDIVEPPQVYPWNNIGEFIIKYYSTDLPRANILIGGAEITQLVLSYEENDIDYIVATLGISTLGDLWDWEELTGDPKYGAGYYRIIFNTSILEVSALKVFEVIPYINLTLYEEATANPTVWVDPLDSSFTITRNDLGISTLNVLFGQDYKVNATLRVIDSTSVLYDTIVSGAHVYYTIYDDGSIIVYEGDLVEYLSDLGKYELDLNSSVLASIGMGNFTVTVGMTLSNFSLTQLGTFNLIVNNLSSSIVFAGDFNTQGSASEYKGDTWNITIQLLDATNEDAPLTGAVVSLTFTDPSYQTILSEGANGFYTILVDWDDIDSIFAEDGTFIGQILASKENYVDAEVQITIILSNRTFGRVYLGDFVSAQIVAYKGDTWNFSVQVLDQMDSNNPFAYATVSITFAIPDYQIDLIYQGNGIYTALVSWDDVNHLFSDNTYTGTLLISNTTFSDRSENIGLNINNRTFLISYLGDFDGRQISRDKGQDWNLTIRLVDSVSGLPITDVDTISIEFPDAGGLPFLLVYVSDGVFTRIVDWTGDSIAANYPDSFYSGTLTIEKTNFSPIYQSIGLALNDIGIAIDYNDDFEGNNPQFTKYQGDSWNLSIYLSDDEDPWDPIPNADVNITFSSLVYTIVLNDDGGGYYSANVAWSVLESFFNQDSETIQGILTITTDSADIRTEYVTVTINARSLSVSPGGDLSDEQIEVYKMDDWNLAAVVIDSTDGASTPLIGATVALNFLDLPQPLSFMDLLDGSYDKFVLWSDVSDHLEDGTYTGTLIVSKDNFATVTITITLIITNRTISRDFAGDFDSSVLSQMSLERGENWNVSLFISDTLTDNDLTDLTVSVKFDDIPMTFTLDYQGNGLYTIIVLWDTVDGWPVVSQSSIPGTIKIANANYTTYLQTMTILLSDRTFTITYLGDFTNTFLTMYKEESWNLSVRLFDSSRSVDLLSADTIEITIPALSTTYELTHIADGVYTVILPWSVLDVLSEGTYPGSLLVEAPTFVSVTKDLAFTLQNRVFSYTVGGDIDGSRFSGDTWNLSVEVYDNTEGYAIITDADVYISFASVPDIYLPYGASAIYNQTVLWSFIENNFEAGTYIGTLHIEDGDNHFTAIEQSFTIEIKNRTFSSTLLGDFDGVQIVQYRGLAWNLSLDLLDLSMGGIPLTGAWVELVITEFDHHIVLTDYLDGSYETFVSWASIGDLLTGDNYQATLTITKTNYATILLPINIYLQKLQMSYSYLSDVTEGGIYSQFVGEDLFFEFQVNDSLGLLSNANVSILIDDILTYDLIETENGVYQKSISWFDVSDYLTAGQYEIDIEIIKETYDTIQDTILLNLRNRTLDLVFGGDFEGALVVKYYGDIWNLSVSVYDESRENEILKDAEVKIYFPAADKEFTLYFNPTTEQYSYTVYWDNVHFLFTDFLYDGTIEVTSPNFSPVSRSISLTLRNRTSSTSYYGDFQGLNSPNIIVMKGDDWNLSLGLFDESRGGIALGGATVYVYIEEYDYYIYFAESDISGEYDYNVVWDDVKSVFIKQSGTYGGILVISKENFETETVNLALLIDFRIIELAFGGGFEADYEITQVKGDVFEFAIQLSDNRTQEPIENANVSIYFESIELTITLTHVGEGLYSVSENFDEISAFTNDNSFSGDLIVEVENYEFAPQLILVTVEMVEAIEGIPTFYMVLGFAGVSMVVGSVGSYRLIQYARIPALVKIISKLQSNIKKKKMVVDEKLVRSREEVIVDRYGDLWELIELDLSEILIPKSQGDDSTPQGGII